MRIQTDTTILWSCVFLSVINISLGSFSLGFHIPVIFFLSIFVLLGRQSISYKNVTLLVMGVLAVTLHFILTTLFTPCTDLLEKSILSFVLFGGLLICLVRLAARGDMSLSSDNVRSLLYIVVFSVVVEQLWLWRNGMSSVIRPSGIYLEPSHLALSIAPPLVALIFSNEKRNRLFGLIVFVALLMLSGSATLFLVVSICAIAAYFSTTRLNYSVIAILRIFFAITVFVSLIYLSPYWDEFDARFNGVFNLDITANISSIVYLNGWQAALQNLKITDGLGLGFNKMGCMPQPSTDASRILDSLGLSHVNYNDGSFTFAKVVSEFGILGIVIWLGAVMLIFRMINDFRLAVNVPPIQRALSISAVVVFIFGGFIRGTNYFAGPSVLGLYFLLSYILQSSRVVNFSKKL